MKLNNGSATLLIIILLSSVIIFFFISFSGLSKLYSVKTVILQEQKQCLLLRDLLEFGIEITAKSNIKYPIEIPWGKYKGIIDFDSGKSILTASLKDDSQLINKITCSVIPVDSKGKKVLINQFTA